MRFHTMAKHKAVTISVTHAEFDAIYHAFNEYNTTLERSDSEEYNKFANKQLDNFESFQKILACSSYTTA